METPDSARWPLAPERVLGTAILPWLHRALGERSTFSLLEVGTFNGLYSLELAARYPNATVVHLEPNGTAWEAHTALGVSRRLPHALFLPYTSEVSRTTTWLETHDLDGRGWRSDRLAPGGPPLAWCTAQALRCASSSLGVVRSLLNDHVLDEFGGRGPTAPDGAGFERLLDSDMSSGLSLKGVVRDRVIAPRLGGPGCEAWSAVLFGPPGTAKTTTAECVAKALGFGFVVVDTACFLEDGISLSAGWFPLACTDVPSVDQLGELQKLLGGAGDSALDPPKYWGQVKDPLMAEYFNLQQGSEEYQRVYNAINLTTGPQQLRIHSIERVQNISLWQSYCCLLYTSPSPRDATLSRMPSSA